MPDGPLYDRKSEPLPANSKGPTERRLYACVLGVLIDAVDMERAIATIDACLRGGIKGYACFVGVHGILEAMHSMTVADAYEHASMLLPDGAPMVWVGRAQGLAEIDHVTGPGLMREIFRRPEFAAYSHFFYGGKAGVAEQLATTLTRQFSSTRVVGTFTPPFRALTALEEEALVREIDRLKPDMVWVGISTPRQDLWMRRMLPRLNTRMIFGVGAAFDYLTGHIRPCPNWIKRAGFNWLHRLVQDPRRLWGRNVKNLAFLWHIALQLIGAKRYPSGPRTASTSRRLLAPECTKQCETAESVPQ